MHKFYVEGADGKTGKDVEKVFEALTEAEALKDAKAMGILVSAVKQMDDIEEPAGRHFSGNSGIVAVSASAAATAAAAGVPDYRFLAIVAAIITAVGVVGIVVGALMVVLGIAGHSEAAFMGLAVIAGGLVQAGLGEGLKAFRDMARNSFRS